VANISPITFHEMESLVESVLESKKTPLFLLLDQLSDVRNFGAIIRTSECTGVDGIIIQKKGAAPVTASTILRMLCFTYKHLEFKLLLLRKKQKKRFTMFHLNNQ